MHATGRRDPSGVHSGGLGPRPTAFLPRGGVGGHVVHQAEDGVHEAEDAADGEEAVPHHPALRHYLLGVRQRTEDQQRQPH